MQTMSKVISHEEIDAIMEEMEAKTPKPGDKGKTFEELNGQASAEEVPKKLADVVDAKSFFSVFDKGPVKPGTKYPSKPTNERYYDFTNSNVGKALIFNQVTVDGQESRKGSRKDADDLEKVLSNIGFDVKVYTDKTVSEIKRLLYTCKFTFE